MDFSKCGIESLLAFGEGKWPAIERAYRLTQDKLFQIESKFDPDLPLLDEDTDFVVFGSIARGEMTTGSDIDWTLLIDGQANADSHLEKAKIFGQNIVALELAFPNQTGAFGDILSVMI